MIILLLVLTLSRLVVLIPVLKNNFEMYTFSFILFFENLKLCISADTRLLGQTHYDLSASDQVINLAICLSSLTAYLPAYLAAPPKKTIGYSV